MKARDRGGTKGGRKSVMGATWCGHRKIGIAENHDAVAAELSPVGVLFHRQWCGQGGVRGVFPKLENQQIPDRVAGPDAGDRWRVEAIAGVNLPMLLRVLTYRERDMDTLLSSIREQLFPLGDDVTVHCGHGPETTIGREKKKNPFLR